MVMQPPSKVCETCGRSFVKTSTMTRWAERRFCDKACRDAARRVHPPTTDCLACGRPFRTPTGRRTNIRYCSLACSGKRRSGPRGDVDGHGRHIARKLYPERLPCEVCGIGYFEGYVARHHIDSDRANNRRSNIRYLCRLHHNAAHRLSDGRVGGGPRPRIAARFRGEAMARASVARELMAQGLSASDVGRQMGYDTMSVYRWLRKYPPA